jgi:serine phosphatase RsbU (regulator of sigma subunit)
MIHSPVLAAVAAGCLVATFVWFRSARRLERAWRRIGAEEGPGSDPEVLARSAYWKELHNAGLYLLLAIVLGATSFSEESAYDLPAALLAIPIGVSVFRSRRFLHEARLAEERSLLERRYEEVLEQEELAPRRWAARLAPEDLPTFEGFEVGRVYEAGEGLMAGDFYDLYRPAPGRLAAVIGDVSGNGIDASITAFQVKYLLRVFLRQYRDPAQALEELNVLMSSQAPGDEFVSLCVVVFDQVAGTLRFASAGHPAAWLWHDGEVRGLRATGPLLTIDPRATYVSREVPLASGDLALLYTDGLAEARSGEQLFGEDRIAAALRRDPGVEAEVLCKSLLAAARDFADAPLSDDVAILAIRRT